MGAHYEQTDGTVDGLGRHFTVALCMRCGTRVPIVCSTSSAIREARISAEPHSAEYAAQLVATGRRCGLRVCR